MLPGSGVLPLDPANGPAHGNCVGMDGYFPLFGLD